MLLEMLVGFDRRRNPAAGLLYSAASDFGRSLGSLGRSLGNLCAEIASSCDTPSTPSPSPTSSYASYATSKPLLALTASGEVVDVSGTSVRPSRAGLNYSKMKPRTIPDYAGSVRSAVAELGKKYKAQQLAVREIKARIESHERINLDDLNREINELQVEIDNCLSSEDELLRQRQSYREEGLLRNVFVHGLAQHSLSSQIGQLREKRNSLTFKQSERKALIAKRNSFDFEAQRDLLKRQGEKLAEIGRDYQRQKGGLDEFDSAMEGCIARLSDKARRLNVEIEKYKSLSRYVTRLNAAANAYERRRVHQECEANFGDGRVGLLCNRMRSKIRSMTASYDQQVRQTADRARAIWASVRLSF